VTAVKADKSTSDSPSGRSAITPGRVVVAALAVLGLVFIFENTRQVRIRLIVPEVTMPLWLALLAVAVIGGVCGAYLARRRK
jgi:uncharacterized integral membrane protein